MARTRIFVSYSHADAKWLGRLQVHLKPLAREGLVDLWDDTRLKGGSDWRDEIRRAIADARIAVLFVSADFLASDFITQNELPPLLAAAQSDGATILPVIVSPSRFEQTPSLSRYRSGNPLSRPLNGQSRAQTERFFKDLADHICQLATSGPPLQPTQRPTFEPSRNRADNHDAEGHGSKTGRVQPSLEGKGLTRHDSLLPRRIVVTSLVLATLGLVGVGGVDSLLSITQGECLCDPAGAAAANDDGCSEPDVDADIAREGHGFRGQRA